MSRPTRRGLALARLGVALPLLAVLAWGAAGCGEGTPSVVAKTTRRPKVAASTQPATKPDLPTKPVAVVAVPVVPVTSYLYFEYAPDDGDLPAPIQQNADRKSEWGIPVAFPQARLRLIGHPDEPVSAMLFSDDPKEAIEKDWQGDRYYLQMPLDQVTDVARLDGAEWWCTRSASGADREDGGNGIYLRGDRYQLEPVNVIVHFDGTPGRPGGVQVRISGQFLQYDGTDPTAKPKPVIVRGVLMPKVETKE